MALHPQGTEMQTNIDNSAKIVVLPHGGCTGHCCDTDGCNACPCLVQQPRSSLQLQHEHDTSGSTPMARFLKEPSHQHGLAFVRPENKAVLAAETDLEAHQAAEQDLAHIGAHLNIHEIVDELLDIHNELGMEEEVETGDGSTAGEN